MLGYRRPASVKAAERQHQEPVDGRPQQSTVAYSRTTLTVAINEPTNTIAAEVNRLNGPPVVAYDNLNINLDDNTADDLLQEYSPT